MSNKPPHDTSLDLKHIIGILKRDDSRCFVTWKKVELHEIDAQEFLSFAQQDLEEDSGKGIVNALSNAKRAIECRIDEILALMNFKCFAQKLDVNLPQKLLVLRQQFDVPAPNVLKNLITSKRNLLEHEYYRPERKEVQDIVEVAQLYLTVTDKWVKQGYITVAEFPTPMQRKEEIKYGRGLNGKGERGGWRYFTEIYPPYIVSFDYEKETLTITYSQGGRIRAVSNETGEIQEQNIPGTERQVNTLSIPKCEKEEVKELMILIWQKAIKRISD